MVQKRSCRQHQSASQRNFAAHPAAVPTDVDAGQIAHFGFDKKGQPSYVLQVLSRNGNGVLTIRGDMQLPNQIFLDRYGLGQTGETFLTDNKGLFLTPPKYPAATGDSQPISGQPLQTWLGGMDGEGLGESYPGVAVIHGFRSVPEI